ncbi:MAG TPA: division plane positioning ATPase MipZ [Alphaproteobacteria bacterium]|jgi:chromosome partitioning protein
MSQAAATRGQVIVLGNEKGGTGKSTSAMHIVVALMRDGYKVASIDLDPHQGTLTRYVENRKAFSESKGIRLPIPEHHCFSGSDADSVTAAENEDKRRLDALVEQLGDVNDYIVIDCPGSDTFLARHALSIADTLITPINDSFIDMDLLAKVGGNPPRVLGPSTYSQIVWEQKVQRAQRNRQSIDWIVMRNRLAQLDSRNKRNVGDALEKLSERIGYRLIDGFSERVIFRQLFLQGLTVLDLRDEGTDVQLNLSHIAARNEIRNLLDAVLGEPEIPAPAPMNIAAGWPPSAAKPAPEPSKTEPGKEAKPAGAEAPAES